jgi:hypothetical protein
MTPRSRLIRREPCPNCGGYVVWTEHVWKERDAQGRIVADAPRRAAYVCENPVCGLVLGPTRYPQDFVA